MPTARRHATTRFLAGSAVTRRERPFDALFALNGVGIAFEPDYCTRVRHQKSRCFACAQACPTGALAFDGQKFAMDPAGCRSCGVCAAACPVDALVAGGVPALVQDAESFAFAKAGPGGVLVHRVPASRGLQLENVDALEASGDNGFLDPTSWSRVQIDVERCNSCRRCAAFCPTGSLYSFYTKMGRIGVKQAVATCTACGLCEDICPRGALHLVGDVTAEQVRGGYVERIVLKAQDFERGGPHSMAEGVRRFIDVDQVSELM